MAKVRVQIKIPQDKEKDISCNCPELCVGCGTETGLESFDSRVCKKKPPITLSGVMQITRADGNYRLCGSCKERAVRHYTETIKKRRNFRVIMRILGIVLIPLSILGMMFLFPNLLFMGPIGYSALMVYWGVMIAIILLVLELAGSINKSQEEMADRVDRLPFRAYVAVTIDGKMILSNETYAEQFRGMNPDLSVQLTLGLQTPGITPDAAVFYMMFTVLFMFILMAVVYAFS